MATITSAATGNWSVGATWVGGVAPGIADDAIVAAGHTVSVDSGANRRVRTVAVRGTLSGQSGAVLSISGAANPGTVYCDASTGIIQDEAVSTNPFLIQNDQDVAGNKVYVAAGTGALNTFYTRIGGGQSLMRYGFASRASPPVWYEFTGLARSRTVHGHRIAAHSCLGRRADRTAWISSSAKTVTMTHLADFGTLTTALFIKQLDDLADGGASLTLVTPHLQLNRCYIEDIEWEEVGGELVRLQSLTVREDLR